MPRKARNPVPLDPPRLFLKELMKARGFDHKYVSLAIKRNPTYIQQFIVNGKPQNLPERAREALGQLFRVDPDQFRQNYAPTDALGELARLYQRVPPDRQEQFLDAVRSVFQLAISEVAPAAPSRRRVGG